MFLGFEKNQHYCILGTSKRPASVADDLPEKTPRVEVVDR